MACSGDVRHRGFFRKAEWQRRHIGISSPEHRRAAAARVPPACGALCHAETNVLRRQAMKERYDYIVIGGGSSGCVAAARLVKEAGARVLLLEAGHSHRHFLLDMPPGIFKMINGSKHMRYHRTVPQEHLGGRVHDIPQGNVLGGGSSVNAQVYMRGRPSDFEEWHQLLRGENDYPGWRWSDV